MVEEFGRGVDVVVCSGVGAADDLDDMLESFELRRVENIYHDCHVFIGHAVVVDWWFEKMRVLF